MLAHAQCKGMLPRLMITKRSVMIPHCFLQGAWDRTLRGQPHGWCGFINNSVRDPCKTTVRLQSVGRVELPNA